MDPADSASNLGLVERARAGDRSAFEALVQPLRQRLLKRIQAQLSPALRERLEPEDVLQETLLHALSSISRFRWQGPDSFLAWLEGIATHFVLHSARGQRRRRELALEREPPALGPSPSRALRRDERFERLQRAIAALSPDYRTAVQLARFEGLKIEEIAARMGRTPSAVKNLLFKAMKRLRESFGDTESLGMPDRALDAGACLDNADEGTTGHERLARD